jgi:PAS domain S-box-containing protein
MPLRRTSLASVVAATLVVVTTALLGTYSIISYRSDAKRQWEALRGLRVVQADELSVALALPVWNIDRAQINRVIDAMSRPKSVYGISVVAAGETYGRVRDSHWEVVPWDGKSAPGDMFVEKRPILFSGNEIGTVRLLVTPKFTRNDLRDTLLRIVSTIVAVDVLLIFSTYLILWRAVVRPLTAIEKYAVAVSKGAAAPQPASGFTAELGSLRSSIETMVRQLDHRYAELIEQEAFTNTAINTIGGIFFVQDREGHFVRWNDTMERLAGGEQLLRERSARTLIHPGDRERVNRKIDEVFDAGQADAETRVVLGTEVKNFAFSARRMEVGGLPFLVATGVDITERRHAEAEQRRLQEAVERSAAEWKETFDTVTTPILITERSGAIVRVNRAALELSALSDEQIAGRRIEEINASEPWQTAAQLITYIAGERQGTTAETKDANGRTWDIIVSRFSAPDGSERFILVLWEITGIVELQESLRRSETMSAMGTLVAGVAHEVRNPLFGISATLDAFHEELSEPGYAECAATLRQEVNRLIHLMQELLEYGKPPALTIDRGDIRSVVGQAVENRLPTALAAQVEIRNEMTETMPTLLMDRSRLRQVFENLIDNAIQHSDPGGVVRITGALADQAGRHWVECTIDDAGPGFSPLNLDRVFEPFFSQREGGTGLGLSIVLRIVEEHSGKVSASNRPEGGGRIRVLFPLADDAMPPAKSTPT